MLYMDLVNNSNKIWNVLIGQHAVHGVLICVVDNMLYMDPVNNSNKIWNVLIGQHAVHGPGQQ